MQQFTVPQFIDVEDKIIGPLTTRQFLIMLGGFMVIGISYKIFDFSLFLFIGVCVFGFSGVLAFFKINGMPFHFFILNFLQTSKKPGLRVWSNAQEKQKATYEPEKISKELDIGSIPVKHVNTSRLAELSLIVDTQGAYHGGIQDKEENIKKLYDLKI